LLTAGDHLDWTKEANVDAVETRARHEVVRLERGLVVLEIVVGIAPLLGLVGTIYGLILLFAELGSTGMTDNSVLAKGISLALNATMLGLITAIPALVAWSYYNKKWKPWPWKWKPSAMNCCAGCTGPSEERKR
jgi:biopolymer transport protein ExbB